MLRKVGGFKFAWGSEQRKMLFIVSGALTAILELEQKWFFSLLCCQDYCIYSPGKFHWGSLCVQEGREPTEASDPVQLSSELAFPRSPKAA